MSGERVLLAIADGVATVTLNRPEALNAFSGTMREDLHAALERAAASARAIVVTGAGKAFSSGGDVRVLAALRREGNTADLRRLVAAGRKVVELLRSLPVPTLAAVNGVAAGAGLGLALACDLRIASREARFGATFSRVGLHPDWGTSFFLTRLVGPAKASDLIFTGRLVGAEEALRIGLVDEVVPAEELARRAGEKARELAAAPPLAVRRAKRAIEDSLTARLEEILDHEESAQVACFASEDCLEGLTAFEEKRPPRFEGK